MRRSASTRIDPISPRPSRESDEARAPPTLMRSSTVDRLTRGWLRRTEEEHAAQDHLQAPSNAPRRFTVERRAPDLRFVFTCLRCGASQWHGFTPDELTAGAQVQSRGRKNASEPRAIEKVNTCAVCGANFKVRLTPRKPAPKAQPKAQRIPATTRGATPCGGADRESGAHGALRGLGTKPPALAQVAALGMQTDEEAMEEIRLIQRQVAAQLSMLEEIAIDEAEVVTDVEAMVSGDEDGRGADGEEPPVRGTVLDLVVVNGDDDMDDEGAA